MRKRYQVGGIAGAAILVLAGFAVWTTSKDGIGFASAKPYEHAFCGEAMTEIAPTEPVTQTTEALLSETEPLSVSFPINLNTADIQTLCTLPDIGAVTAQAILDELERLGGFTNRAQLRDVPGIGEKRYQVIAGLIYIENEQPLPTEPAESTIPATVSETDAPETEMPAPETQPPTVPVINLNTATLDDLLRLPGCDEETANAILELREQIGIIHNPLELTMVISKDLYKAWEPYLAVDDTGSTQLPIDTLPAE